MSEHVDIGKRRARNRINAMIYRGMLPAARTLPCSECAAMWVEGDKPHVYHHPKGYDGPNALIVVPMCNDCRLAEHGNSRSQTTEWKVRSVRLDSDVWEAVRAMPISLNVYLRLNLLSGAKPAKVSKKAAHIAALKASDPLGADREDIEHGNMELPSGGSVGVVGAARPVARVETSRKSDAYQVRGMRPKGAGKDR